MAQIIVYLDQLHWIEIAKAINGIQVKPGTQDVLKYIMKLSREGQAIFPLSFSHYLETLKQSDPGRRERLAEVMHQISGGKTVAAQNHIVSYEIQVALKHFFPKQVIPEKFSYLGNGFEHAFGKSLPFELIWPDSESVTERTTKAKIESDVFDSIEKFLISGVMRFKDVDLLFPKQNLSANNKFKQHLEEWKGRALQISQNELEREIYSITFNDIKKEVFEELNKFNISLEDFDKIGELGFCKLLDLMPTRKVDMHLRQQWAKNVNLPCRQSDLNDWCFIGSAVCYSDVVVTENQMCDLLSRAIDLKAKVTSNLADLMRLIHNNSL